MFGQIKESTAERHAKNRQRRDDLSTQAALTTRCDRC